MDFVHSNDTPEDVQLAVCDVLHFINEAVSNTPPEKHWKLSPEGQNGMCRVLDACTTSLKRIVSAQRN